MQKYPLVLVPGLMCDHRLWQPQIEAFSNERPVIVPNLSVCNSVPEMANCALNSVDGDFVLAGLSMGGIVAFEMWRQAPTRIKGLALLDTNALKESEARKAERLRQIEDVRRGDLVRILVEELKPNYLAAVHRADKNLLNTLRQMGEDQGAGVFERHSRALMVRSDSLETLATITCPTCVLCGQEDELCPVEYHQMMASHIPNANLITLPDCGHMSSLEAPAIVNSMLADLIKRAEKAKP